MHPPPPERPQPAVPANGSAGVRVRQLRDDLRTGGFTLDALEALWGPVAAAALHRGTVLPARRALGAAAAAPLATLAALFVLGDPVPAGRAAAALPSLGLDGAAELGLLHLADGAAHPLLDLRPYRFDDARGEAEWWIASDLGELALGGPLPPEHVLGVGGASLTLSRLLLPDAVGSVLDLGTGCGIQAMHASRIGARVVATDVSARAVAFARLNAELNGIAGIEFQVGDGFAPVAGERFDRVISNPPFVITPRAAGVPAYGYRDGGRVGDAFLEELVRALPDVLEPGGVAQLLGNWEYRDGTDGMTRVATWADGLDLIVIERERQDPVAYAETWIRDGGTRPGTPGYDDLLTVWIDDAVARGVTEIGFGYLTLRRPDAGRTPVLDVRERLDGDLPPALGPALAARLLAADRLHDLDDPALLACRLRVAADVTEERFHRPGEAEPSVLRLRRGDGFGGVVGVDTAVAGFVGACDGTLRAGALIAALADLLEVDEGSLRAGLLPRVRELIERGVLLLGSRAAVG